MFRDQVIHGFDDRHQTRAEIATDLPLGAASETDCAMVMLTTGRPGADPMRGRPPRGIVLL